MQAKAKRLLNSFFRKFELKSFAKGETFVSPGKNLGIFFLEHGVVKMTGLAKGKIGYTLNLYKSFSLFPMSLIFNGENNYTYTSLTKVRGYFAPARKFTEFIKKNPEVQFDLLKRVYRGLEGFFMLLQALLSKDAFLMTLTQLIIYARRFGKENQNVVNFDWHLTHEQLASQTGLARESVTRQIKKLQDKGLVNYSGKKLLIRDLKKLEEEFLLPLDNRSEL